VHERKQEWKNWEREGIMQHREKESKEKEKRNRFDGL